MNIGRPELVWDSHLNHVGYMLRDMFINSKYTDVVLVCEDGGRFKVHRNVLSSCSEKFKEIFEDDENISSIFLYGIVSFEFTNSFITSFIQGAGFICPLIRSQIKLPRLVLSHFWSSE